MNQERTMPLVQISQSISFEAVNKHKYLAMLAGQLMDWRIEKGANQAALAEMLGISQSMVSRYENMQENPSAETMAEIQSKLGILVEDIYCKKPKREVKIIQFPFQQKGSSTFSATINGARCLPKNEYNADKAYLAL